eukprot:TRINITY_DN22314_c0_g1_i1.p1 TRINITY_DN22314_c0_g1~~TRINITY_DN22314_c0_g1_i1.p1  ORF type:complete len:303 (-),score=36.88 TRINITY_DN22314_c0_g1_i1:230-1081(-)
MNLAQEFVAGGIGGLVSVFFGYPLDSIKVRLQTNEKTYRGFFHCVQHTYKLGGVREFYKGITAPLLGTPFIYALSFFGFALGKALFVKDQQNMTSIELLVASAFSGLCHPPIMVPVERVKCVIQSHTLNPNAAPGSRIGTYHVLQKLLKQEGIKSLYKGYIWCQFRELVGSVVWFFTYSRMKELLVVGSDSMDSSKTVLAGAVTGMTYWVCIYPLDTIKSRIQVSSVGIPVHLVIRSSLRLGIRQLFSGVGAALGRSLIAHTSSFWAYELALERMRKLSEYKM